MVTSISVPNTVSTLTGWPAVTLKDIMFGLQVAKSDDILAYECAQVRTFIRGWDSFEVRTGMDSFPVEEFALHVKESVFLFTGGFLEDADRFGFVFPLPVTKINNGVVGQGVQKSRGQLFFAALTEAKLLDLSIQVDEFVTGFIREGFKVSAELGQERACLIQGSQFMAKNLLSVILAAAVKTAALHSLSMVEGAARKVWVERGWIPPEIG